MLQKIYLILLCFSIHFLANCLLRQRSKLFDDKRPSTRLEGYIIATVPARDRKNCAIVCLRTEGCYSFNFCGKKSCELNSAAGGDVNESAWVYSDSCEYMGTPDDCFQQDPRNETCFWENCNLLSEEFHWHYKPVFDINEENSELWDKFMVPVCLNGENSEMMRSNCEGCPPKQSSNQSVLLKLDAKPWDTGKSDCEQLGGTLFAQLGETVKAFMDMYWRIGKKRDDPDRFIYLGISRIDNEWVSTETGKAVPSDDILWASGQPSYGYGHVAMWDEEYRTEPNAFMHDIHPNGYSEYICSIKTQPWLNINTFAISFSCHWTEKRFSLAK